MNSNLHSTAYKLCDPERLSISTELLFSHLQKPVNITSFTWLTWGQNEVKYEKDFYCAQHIAALINFSFCPIKTFTNPTKVIFLTSVIPEIKTYDKATVLKTVWYCLKNRQTDQWYIIRMQKIVLFTGEISLSWIKDSLFQKVNLSLCQDNEGQ